MDFSEKWGTDVDTAVQLALDELNLTIDEVTVSVLEEPSRGFLGIGSKLALVRVEKKKKEKEKHPEPKKEVKKQEKQEKPAKPAKAAKPKAETSKKPAEPALSILPVEEEDLTPCEDHAALTFLRDMTKNMGLDLDISAKAGKDVLYVDINGKDSGTIIGKRGQTLDAVQYLTSLVVNKEHGDYTRVVVDAENYRSKREKTLEELANRLAGKVIKTRRSVRLEPMNPYERKVIHATLQNNPNVTTRSEGQDPYRRVIIELK